MLSYPKIWYFSFCVSGFRLVVEGGNDDRFHVVGEGASSLLYCHCARVSDRELCEGRWVVYYTTQINPPFPFPEQHVSLSVPPIAKPPG